MPRDAKPFTLADPMQLTLPETPGFAVKGLESADWLPVASLQSASKGRHCKRLHRNRARSLLERPGLSHTARRAPPRRWRLSGCDVQSFVAAGDFDCPNGGSRWFARYHSLDASSQLSRPQSATNSCSLVLNLIHASSPRHEHLASWTGMCG
jgi:hypothetical protein